VGSDEYPYGRTLPSRFRRMILRNGTIRTLDPQLPAVRALAIAGDSVAGGVGVHETALPSPDVVDLRGRCVLPAFTDAHVHFPSWALARDEVRLEGVTSLAEALGRIATAAAALPEGRPLRGYGWRDAEWAEKPSREALDRVTGGRAAALVSKDSHSLWLNTAAGGAGDGVLRESDAWDYRERQLRPDAVETVNAMRRALEVVAARGVTCIHDFDGGRDALSLWQRLRAQTQLTVRVWQTQPHQRLEHLAALGIRSGFGDELLRVGHLKVFMDGALGSGTAAMLDASGVVTTTRDELAEIVRQAASSGLAVAVHAIGDRAVRDALDGFASASDGDICLPLPHRIEHVQCIDPTDLPRLAELGIAASVQFSHAVSDRDLADRAWRGHPGAYAYRSLAETGVLLANGSDAPVEELDPWAGICAAVRRTDDERPPWRPKQALTLEQALHAVCVAPALLTGDERRRGTLLPGRHADLVVLDRDPFPLEPDELPAVRIVATMLGGRWVYNPPPWD
jgi:predicted amidohydrolase YtcJ